MNVLERLILEMGSTWAPTTGGLDVGIDGFIELFDPVTREPLGTILAAQSKAVSTLTNETAEDFDYYCAARDIEYWLRGTLPVILVISRPHIGDAYWVCVTDYFRKPENAATTRIRVSKAASLLSNQSMGELVALGRPATAGLYLPPLPREEKLYSNLLPLRTCPASMWMASTTHRFGGALWRALREAGGDIGGAWLLRDGRIYSFHDLDEHPWTAVCDEGTCERFDTREWSDSNDPDQQRLFVQLLNRTLHDQLYPDVRYWPMQDCYALVAQTDGSRKARYKSVKRDSTLTAVSKFSKTVDGRTFEWYRHMAFEGQFRRLDGAWFLEITPTYRFTTDGEVRERFHEERLKTIKRLEGNRAVLSAVLFWADYLRSDQGLFATSQPLLAFDEPLQFTCNVGIDDKSWSSVDPQAPRKGAVTAAQRSLLDGLDEEHDA